MTTTFIESGTDATQDLSFYSSTVNTVASATDQAHTGPRSLKCSSGAGNSFADAFRTGVLADAGRRISMWFRFDSTPSANCTFLAVRQSDVTTVVTAVRLTNGLVLTIEPTGATFVTGTTVLAANTWYRISLSYYITNSTTFQFKVYINGVLELTANAGTLTNVTSDAFNVRIGAQGANRNHWFDDIYVDDGASSGSQPDTGNILVTAKRPLSNGTTNGYTTQIGAGGSGYGTGHAPQVNEQPLSATNGWAMVGAGSAITEEYNIEGATVGDVNISGLTIVDYVGWVYTKALVGETGKMVLNAATPSITITTSNSMITAFAGSTSYPAGTGTDIGEITSTDLTTVSLYECGIVIAYYPGVVQKIMLLRRQMDA